MIKRIAVHDKLKNSQKLRAIGLYSLLWSICALILLAIFNYNDKSFLWVNDGIYQHFSSFQYLCDYLKEIIYNHSFKESFNFTLGQGMDILTTLNSYDFTDPISVLCALIFPLSRASRYTLMIFIKLYLIGFSFLFYCFAIDKDKVFPIVGGAIAYAFSGAILFTVARHPNYINWAYFFPFILGGIELYLRKKKKLPLAIFVFLNILTSYYTFYMNAILAVIYVIVNAACKVAHEKTLDSLKNELKRGLGVAGVFCLGGLLSACVLLPTLYAYLNNARIAEASGYTASLWHYTVDNYVNAFEDVFAAYRNFGYTSFIGLNAVMIIPLTLIFTKKGQHTSLKWLVIISIVMLCVPLAGRIMNGFGYASNRWAYAIPFYISLVFVMMFYDMAEMTDKEKACVYLVTVAYIVLCLFHTSSNTNVLKYSALIMVAAVAIIVSISLRYKFPRYEPFILAIVLAGACFQVYFTFAPTKGNYVSTFLDSSKVSTSFSNYSSRAARDLDDEFYRVEMEETRTNVNGYNNVDGTGFWWSLVPSYVMDYYTDLAIDSVSCNCASGDLGGRTGLLALASVKYYTRPAKETGFLPYGYEEIESSNSKYQVYENQYALPIGYTYSSYVTTDQYAQMDGIEKEQAMLQGVVLEDIPEGFEPTELNFDYDILDYEIVDVNGVTLNEDTINVTEASGTVTLSVNVPDDYEIYVYIHGIELLGSSSSLVVKATRETDEYSFTRSSTISNLNYSWPVLRDDVCYDLGYGYPGENTIILTFNSKGKLAYDDIQIVAVSMASYVENVEKLGEYVLENVVVGNDQITGTISLPESKILQLSVPYSDGWKAYVDGEEVEIIQSDVMYMAILMPAGEHTVELYYETPYMKLGFSVTGITIVLWIFIEAVNRRRKKISAVQ